MVPDQGRLRWRCRRGMKELDLLLTRYVDERYANASLPEQEAFRGLLEAQDPVIYAYCLGQERPPPHLADLIERITAARSADC
ncbi:MAG TPA: succinate dehydrogenase assembly factor 2 [Steroidobacteraceae bacterium]|jgi:antitoxin CptB|nr:succinate dehydrogenase assembly factor 2 [Steroidobacteraceae bacterium]